MLNTPESFRKNFKDFRRWVLEKAYKDISKHTTLSYEWEPIKKGRSVDSIRFIFSKAKSSLVAKIKKEKKLLSESKQSNKMFQIAMACFKERGLDCDGCNQSTTICEICKKVR